MIKLPSGKTDKSKIVRNLGKKYKYVPYLEKAIGDFEDEWAFEYHEKQPDNHWHPSSHCVPPATELYAIATGQVKPEPIGNALRKTFQVGHFWHQWLQYITVAKLGFANPEDIERHMVRSWGQPDEAKGILIPDFHAIAGSADVCPCVCPDWTGLVDYKTMNSANFKQQGLPPRFEAKYECQINVYMDLFDVAEAIILPVHKDTGDFKEFLYERNQPLVDTIMEKLEFVSVCLDAGEAPTAEDDKMFAIAPLLRGPVSV